MHPDAFWHDSSCKYLSGFPSAAAKFKGYRNGGQTENGAGLAIHPLTIDNLLGRI
jgi:hypothetical protein